MRCFTEHSETHNKNFKHRRGKMNATLDEVGTLLLILLKYGFTSLLDYC